MPTCEWAVRKKEQKLQKKKPLSEKSMWLSAWKDTQAEAMQQNLNGDAYVCNQAAFDIFVVRDRQGRFYGGARGPPPPMKNVAPSASPPPILAQPP